MKTPSVTDAHLGPVMRSIINWRKLSDVSSNNMQSSSDLQHSIIRCNNIFVGDYVLNERREISYEGTSCHLAFCSHSISDSRAILKALQGASSISLAPPPPFLISCNLACNPVRQPLIA